MLAALDLSFIESFDLSRLLKALSKLSEKLKEAGLNLTACYCELCRRFEGQSRAQPRLIGAPM